MRKRETLKAAGIPEGSLVDRINSVLGSERCRVVQFCDQTKDLFRPSVAIEPEPYCQRFGKKRNIDKQ